MNSNFDSLDFIGDDSFQPLNDEKILIWYMNFALNGIVYTDSWKSAYISFEDLKKKHLTKIFDGKIFDVSRDGTQVVYQKRSMDNDNVYIYDIRNDKHKKLKINVQTFDVCFSPDGKYLAYSDVTNNLMNDVFLKIYDLSKDKTYITGYCNKFSKLVTWIK